MNFAPEVATPAPVMPPPPPPRNAACDDRQPTLVFFDWDSDIPDEGSSETIRAKSELAIECGWSAFSVVGHADRSGSDSYNLELSERRAQAIANLMSEAGIPVGSIDTSAQGEANPRVPTQDGVREPQNRRVEITVDQ